VPVLQAEACNTGTTQTQPHQISNTQRTENKTTDMVIQQHSRKLLMVDILISETCRVHKKWNKIASDIKLVFYSSTITMMHGPINIRCTNYSLVWKVISLQYVNWHWLHSKTYMCYYCFYSEGTRLSVSREHVCEIWRMSADSASV